MKRIFIAFNFLILLLGLQGEPKFYIHKSAIEVLGYPSDGIDRFDTCCNLSPLLYISYVIDNKQFVFVIKLKNESGAVFKPSSNEECKNGWFQFSSLAEINKEYANELPEGINLSAEDQDFYENRPENFKVLKNCHIKTKEFHLTIDLFDQTIIYGKEKKGKAFCETGKLVAFYYL